MSRLPSFAGSFFWDSAFSEYLRARIVARPLALCDGHSHSFDTGFRDDAPVRLVLLSSTKKLACSFAAGGDNMQHWTSFLCACKLKSRHRQDSLIGLSLKFSSFESLVSAWSQLSATRTLLAPRSCQCFLPDHSAFVWRIANARRPLPSVLASRVSPHTSVSLAFVKATSIFLSSFISVYLLP